MTYYNRDNLFNYEPKIRGPVGQQGLIGPTGDTKFIDGNYNYINDTGITINYNGSLYDGNIGITGNIYNNGSLYTNNILYSDNTSQNSIFTNSIVKVVQEAKNHNEVFGFTYRPVELGDTNGTTFFSIPGVGANTPGFNSGVLAPNGMIYCIPGAVNVNAVGVINPNNNTGTITIPGLTGLSANFKYGGGCLAPNGKIYGIPTTANDVLIIDPNTDTYVRETFGGIVTPGYYCGIVGLNGNIYCPPNGETFVLVINPIGNTAYKTDFGISINNNYRSACLGLDGKIYCIPNGGGTLFLIIDPLKNTAKLDNLGFTNFVGYDKFWGAVLGPDGKIYGVPHYLSDGLLVIDTINQIAKIELYGLTIGNYNNAFTPFWKGGALGADGLIYCAPNNSNTYPSNFLIIDAIRKKAYLTELNTPLGGLPSQKYNHIVLAQNGKLYCIQNRANWCICIVPSVLSPYDNFTCLHPALNKF